MRGGRSKTRRIEAGRPSSMPALSPDEWNAFLDAAIAAMERLERNEITFDQAFAMVERAGGAIDPELVQGLLDTISEIDGFSDGYQRTLRFLRSRPTLESWVAFESNPSVGLYEQISGRSFWLIVLGFASFLGLTSLGGLFPNSRGAQFPFAMLGMLSFGACAVIAMLKSRCPYCGWVLYLSQTAFGIPWAHPWVDKVCSACKRDLTKRLDPTPRP